MLEYNQNWCKKTKMVEENKNGGRKQKIQGVVWFQQGEHNKTLDKLKTYSKDQAVADARQLAKELTDKNALLRQQVQMHRLKFKI